MLHFLLAQHNEHRIAVPRIFFLADLEWFGGQSVSLVIANVVIQLASWAGLCRLIWPSVPNPLDRAMAMALSLAVLFSAAQVENFIWGFQVQFVGVYAASIWACICAAKNKKLFACILALVATLMMANGLFIWLVLALVALASRRPRTDLFLYGLGFVFCLVGYLFEYQRIAGHTPVNYVLTHPFELLIYLFVYLGGAAALKNPLISMLIGTGAILFFCAITLQALRRREMNPPQFWALWGIAVYILISAGVTAVGRVSFGMEQALAGRYVTPSSVFLVTLAFAWISLEKKTIKIGSNGPRQLIGDAFFFVVVSTVIVLIFVNHVRSKPELKGRHERLNMSSDAIASGVRDLRVYGMTYSETEDIDRDADWLKSARLSIFSQRPWSLVGKTVGVDIPMAPEGRCIGRIDVAEPFAGESRTGSATQVTGWAWDTQKRRRPPHLLLVDASNRVTGFASAMIPRVDVLFALRTPRAMASGWSGYDSQAVPTGAYGLIDGGRFACRL